MTTIRATRYNAHGQATGDTDLTLDRDEDGAVHLRLGSLRVVVPADRWAELDGGQGAAPAAEPGRMEFGAGYYTHGTHGFRTDEDFFTTADSLIGHLVDLTGRDGRLVEHSMVTGANRGVLVLVGGMITWPSGIRENISRIELHAGDVARGILWTMPWEQT